MRFAALCCSLPFAIVAQVNGPGAAEIMVLERFASHPAARVVWSGEVDRIRSGDANAVITAIAVEREAPEYGRMRGVRIDLNESGAADSVYIPEGFLGRLVAALDEIDAGWVAYRSRSTASSSCFGSCAFLSALREGAHVFHASRCEMADGWSGLSVSTGRMQFRFGGLAAGPFARGIEQAADELKRGGRHGR